MLTDKQALKNLASNLGRLLGDHGWKQADLARATSESEMQISRYVRGVQMPGAAVLARMAEALDASTDNLLAFPVLAGRRK